MTHYPEYKQTEFAWIGEIPFHWSLNRINSLFFRRKEKNTNIISDNILSVLKDRGVIRYEDKGNIGNKVSERIDNYQLVHPGDLVINNMNVTIGSVGRSDQFGALSGIYIVLAPKRADVSMPYYDYLFKIRPFQKSLIQISSGLMKIREALNFVEFKALKLPTPPVPEQTQIANFLDHNTAQIDELIRAKERKIELLGEYRASLINQAVTKGLDPNVEMKPSGVEWIGKIPKHWEVKRIKYLARLISKGTTPTTIGKEIWDHGEIRFIKAENIVDNQIKFDPEHYIDEETNQMLKRSQLYENDILFVIAGTIGKVGLVRRNHLPANTNQAVSFIRPHEKELSEFIYYWLQADNIQQIVWRDVVQSAQPNLSMEDLGNLYIPYPGIIEQKHIVDYISNKTQSIAQLLQQVFRQIELLKEYRQSLISEVVTGKIDVRGEV